MQMAMRGFKGRTLPASRSSTPLEIRGHFHIQGSQIVGDEVGCAPSWIADIFDRDEKVESVSFNYKNHGVVFSRPSCGTLA